MLLLSKNSRLEQNITEKGIAFYEKDVAFINYVFSGDIKLEFTLKYKTPGFGIVLAQNKNDIDPFETDLSYLFKVGVNNYSVYKKSFLTQALEKSNTNIISPDNQDKTLRFIKSGLEIVLELDIINTTGRTVTYELGRYTLSQPLSTYNIGFYSSAGNSLKELSVLSGSPEFWFTNIKNTNGGRIEFNSDTICIENCLYKAEIEQSKIPMKAGTYYLDYELYDVNNMNDIEVYVFICDEDNIFAKEKNILEKDNRFALESDNKINIFIRGTNGYIKNICIKDNIDSSYISNDKNSSIKLDGSYILIDLSIVKKFEIIGVIQNIPKYELHESLPYNIIGYNSIINTLESLKIKLDAKYKFTFNKDDSILVIENVNGEIIYSDLLNVLDYVYIFKNIKGFIESLIVWDYEDNRTDILLQRTHKKYVTNKIETPIIITDSNNNPLDLSSSFREKIIHSVQKDIFKNYYNTLELTKNILIGSKITLYATNDILVDIDNIDNYNVLSSDLYSIDYLNSKIMLKENEYRNYIVEYEHMNNIEYVFTNWAREKFNQQKILELSSSVSSSNGSVILYGIKHNAVCYDNNIFKVRNYINAIDLYTKDYEILKDEAYSIDYESGLISINSNVYSNYEFYIVDYLKNNSYCINNLFDRGQYEVDISTDIKEIKTQYDLSDDGQIAEYRDINVKPTNGQYIIIGGEEI